MKGAGWVWKGSLSLKAYFCLPVLVNISIKNAYIQKFIKSSSSHFYTNILLNVTIVCKKISLKNVCGDTHIILEEKVIFKRSEEKYF